MIRRLYYRFKSWRELKSLDKQERRLWDAYEKETNKDEASIIRDELSQIIDRQRAISDHWLVIKAQRHYVAVPPRSETDGYWEQGMDHWYLTVQGIKHLRQEIRAEQKARRESVLAWVPLIAALTGLGAVIVGIITALSR